MDNPDWDWEMEEMESNCSVDNLQDLPEYVVDLDTRVQSVERLLQSNRRVAIIGFGGVGKTTLAMKLFNNLCSDYEYTCFYSTVKVNLKEDAQPKDLQEGILANLYHEGKKVKRHEFQWRLLQGKKILLILDDVDSENHLLELDEFARDSRLIVTSRNDEFLKDFAMEEIAQLDFHHSKRLLCHHAFKDQIVPRDPAFERVLGKLVLKCDGLPLTLEATGSSLYKAQYGAWEEAFDKLDRAESLDGSDEDRIWAKLRISYDALAQVEKEMFLDVAVLCKNAGLGELKLHELKLYWKETLQSAEKGWQNLKDRCLVQEKLDKTGQTYAWMHEQLRDLGRRIACPPTERSESHSRICFTTFNNQWVSSNRAQVDFLMSSNRQGECQAKAVKLSRGVGDCVGAVELDITVFSKFPHLRLLLLDGVSLHGDPVDHLVLFPRQLAIFKLLDCSYERLFRPPYPPMQFQLKNLVILDLSWGAFFEIPGLLSSLCTDLGIMHKLRILRIRFTQASWNRIDIVKQLSASLGNLLALEELSIAGWRGLDRLPASFSNLPSLQTLNLGNCPDLLELPPFSQISYTQRSKHPLLDTQVLQVSSGMPCSLEEIVLISCPLLRDLPASLGDLSNLRRLTIKECGNLTSLPDTVGQLKQLKYFELRCCSGLKKLPDSFTELISLETFLLSSGSVKFNPIPAKMAELSALRHLAVDDQHDCETECLEAGRLPESLWDLPTLEHFQLTSCCGLSRLPVKFITLPRLRVMILIEKSGNIWYEKVGGEKMNTLPDCIEKLTSLEYLAIYFHGQLTSLPPKFGQLHALENLTLYGCPHLTSLSEGFGELAALQVLHIVGSGLSELPDNFGQLRRLRILSIEGCKMLTRLPEDFGALTALQNLILADCPRLSKLPNSFAQLPSLEKLAVANHSECAFLDILKGMLPGTIVKRSDFDERVNKVADGNDGFMIYNIKFWLWVREGSPIGSSVETEHFSKVFEPPSDWVWVDDEFSETSDR